MSDEGWVVYSLQFRSAPRMASAHLSPDYSRENAPFRFWSSPQAAGFRNKDGVASAPMSDTSAQQWATASGEPVTELERWGSVWADLLLVDMVLLERRELPTKPSTAFQRRGLWESAVIAYGRADQSQWERPVPFKDFVREVAGEDGMATHDRIMDWRHGHVAHRNRAEFESVETAVEYAQGSPTGLYLVIASDIGPKNDHPFVAEFERHVKLLRDTMYETKISPLAMQLVDVLGSDQVALTAPGPAQGQSSAERLVITQHLATLHVAD
jgi:hypothetical protein